MSALPDKSPDVSGEPFDPVFLHARRELVAVVLLFAVFFLWAVGVCYMSGYGSAGQGEAIALTLGMPSWAFWGLLVPWVAVDGVAIWFCFFFMKDDDLGEAHEGEDLAEQIEHEHEKEEGRDE